MELLVLIFFCWVIGAMFPGSPGRMDWPDPASIAAALVLWVGLFVAWACGVSGVFLAADWLGFGEYFWVAPIALLGPIVVPISGFAAINHWRLTCQRSSFSS